MARDRAKAGGEIGTNGEFYEGGKFLPSTERAKGTAKKRRAATRKVEIEPRVWAVCPEGMRSLFRTWNHTWKFGWNGEAPRQLRADTGEIHWAAFGGEAGRLASAAALERYLAGDRFEPYPAP